MDIGMLWFDDDTKRPLGEKVSRAVEYYKTKYGRQPTVCFINPATLKDAPDNAAGVQLRSARNVMVDHFWLGVGDANGTGNGRGNGHAAQRKASARGQRQAVPVPPNGRPEPLTGRAG